tara:strand:+ start:1057 stop:1383 length:327 start_codon:yes stop_codon:yes gene_type:complete
MEADPGDLCVGTSSHFWEAGEEQSDHDDDVIGKRSFWRFLDQPSIYSSDEQTPRQRKRIPQNEGNKTVLQRPRVRKIWNGMVRHVLSSPSIPREVKQTIIHVCFGVLF